MKGEKSRFESKTTTGQLARVRAFNSDAGERESGVAAGAPEDL
jgi:hypothetical protein